MSSSVDRSSILVGAIPISFPDFKDAVPLKQIAITIADTAITSTASTSTTELLPATISAKPLEDKKCQTTYKVKQIISTLKFMNSAMRAVITGSSLECFSGVQFSQENEPMVNHHHLNIAISAFSIEGMLFFKRFEWEPPFDCDEIIVTNLVTDLKRENHERILRYVPFVLELIEELEWDPVFLHQYYLTFDNEKLTTKGLYIFRREHLYILNQIRDAYEFSPSDILIGLNTQELEEALDSPFLKDFGLTEKEIKQQIAEVKKVKK